MPSPKPSQSPPASPKNVDISSSIFSFDISCSDISNNFSFDISGVIEFDLSSSTIFSLDTNDTPFDISLALHLSPDISLSSHVVSISGGIETITESGIKSDGTVIYQTISFTTDASNQIQISEDLSAIIQILLSMQYYKKSLNMPRKLIVLISKEKVVLMIILNYLQLQLI